MAFSPDLISVEQLLAWREHFPQGHIINVGQFTIPTLRILYQLANYMARKAKQPGWTTPLENRSAAIMFKEPSTRTFGAFCQACNLLGLKKVESQVAKDVSSMKKGESDGDTLRTYASLLFDIIIMRSADPDFAERAAASCQVPFINGGSGSRSHPTQALLDLYTIYQARRGVENLTYLFVGDLRFGRTVQSLVRLLTLFDNIEFIFAAPEFLQIPPDLRSHLEKRQAYFRETTDLREALTCADVFYTTRVQAERFSKEQMAAEGVTEAMFRQAYDAFRMPIEAFELGRQGMIGLHPLPRVSLVPSSDGKTMREVVGELPIELDARDGALWWQAVTNGVYVRMALVFLLLITPAELAEMRGEAPPVS